MNVEPTVADLIISYKNGIIGLADELADDREGSGYELIGGPAAILWNRQAQRDTDKFNSTRIKTAVGDTLTTKGLQRYGIQRILDTKGQGVATFSRLTTGGGAGVVWSGTRVRISSSLTDSRYYEVLNDISFSATDLSKDIAIQAIDYGVGVAVESVGAAIDDLLWDNTLTVTYARCSNGTTFESAQDYVARIRKTRLDARSGNIHAITAACNAVGAVRVALFASNYGSNDYGLNVCYVGFADYSSSTDLVNRCKVALESARCAGDNLQVLQMTPAQLYINLTATLVSAPSTYDQIALTRYIIDSLIQDLANNGAWGYTTIGLSSNIIKNVPEVQGLSLFVSENLQGFSPGDRTVQVTTNGLQNFPAVLPRYFIQPYNVSVKLNAP